MSQLKWKLETITPEKAKAYLATSTANRGGPKGVMPARVKWFCDIIINGEFKLTHQGIAFNENGVLRDGHHRLEAIAMSGKAVQMWVCRGVTDEAVIAMDCGAPRTLKHHFGFRGLNMDFSAIAAANVCRLAPKLAVVEISRPEAVLAFISRHHDAIQFGRRCVTGGRGHSALMGACARAYYHMTPDQAERLAAILRSGEAVDRRPGDRSLIKLRDLFMQTRGNSGGTMRTELYAKAQNAIWSYLNGVDIQRLSPSYDDLFPLPVEGE